MTLMTAIKYISNLYKKKKKDNGTQLTIPINIASPKNNSETCTMHSKSDKIETMVGNKTNEIIEELLDSLLEEYQKSLEE